MRSGFLLAVLLVCGCALVLAGSWGGCKGSSAPDSLRVDKPDSVAAKFLVIRILPLGLSLEEAKRRLPSLSVVADPSDTTGDVPLMASGSFTMEGHEVVVRCWFEGGILAYYTCTIESMEAEQARMLHREARRVYTMAYGNFHEAIRSHPLQIINHWSSDAFMIRLELSAGDTLFSVKWGFGPLPTQPEPEEQPRDEEPLAAHLVNTEEVT